MVHGSGILFLSLAWKVICTDLSVPLGEGRKKGRKKVGRTERKRERKKERASEKRRQRGRERKKTKERERLTFPNSSPYPALSVH